MKIINISINLASPTLTIKGRFFFRSDSGIASYIARILKYGITAARLTRGGAMEFQMVWNVDMFFIPQGCDILLAP